MSVVVKAPPRVGVGELSLQPGAYQIHRHGSAAQDLVVELQIAHASAVDHFLAQGDELQAAEHVRRLIKR